MPLLTLRRCYAFANPPGGVMPLLTRRRCYAFANPTERQRLCLLKMGVMLVLTPWEMLCLC